MTDQPDKVEPDKPKKKPEPRRPGGKQKRGPGKWLLRIFRGYDAAGKRIYYHSCASALLNAGVPLKMISDRLGHSSIAITADVYSVVEEQQREASERIEHLFKIGNLG
jgi:integrase